MRYPQLISRSVAISLGVLCAMLIGVVAAPLSTSGLGPQPNPIGDYAAAAAAATRRQHVDDSVAAPGGESLLLAHGHRTPRVVVLLHGFTNSPTQFAVLAKQLYDAGDNVYVPRLPEHAERGVTASALARLTAEQLRGSADSAIDIAAGLGDSVIVLGLSAGGTMACWIAQNRPEVERAVIVAPVIALARVPRLLDAPLLRLSVRLPNFTHADPIDAEEPDREQGWTSRAVGQILLLGLAVRRDAANTAPATRDVRVLLNAHDHTISASAVLDIARSWATHGAMVQAYELPDSLGLPHDVIDPRQRVARPDVVYPLLIALAHGESAPPSRVRRRE